MLNKLDALARIETNIQTLTCVELQRTNRALWPCQSGVTDQEFETYIHSFLPEQFPLFFVFQNERVDESAFYISLMHSDDVQSGRRTVHPFRTSHPTPLLYLFSKE